MWDSNLASIYAKEICSKAIKTLGIPVWPVFTLAQPQIAKHSENHPSTVCKPVLLASFVQLQAAQPISEAGNYHSYSRANPQLCVIAGVSSAGSAVRKVRRYMAYSGAICVLQRRKITSPILGPNHHRHHIGPPSSLGPIPHWTNPPSLGPIPHCPNWRCGGLAAPPNSSRSCSKNTTCRATSSIDFHPNHHDHVAAGSTLMEGPGPQCHQSMVGSPAAAPPSSQSSGLGLLGLAAAWVGASRFPGQRPQFRQAWACHKSNCGRASHAAGEPREKKAYGEERPCGRASHGAGEPREKKQQLKCGK